MERKQLKKQTAATISTKVEPEFKDQILDYCKEHDITVAQLIRRALKSYFEQ